jgi:hypothetical protein
MEWIENFSSKIGRLGEYKMKVEKSIDYFELFKPDGKKTIRDIYQ